MTHLSENIGRLNSLSDCSPGRRRRWDVTRRVQQTGRSKPHSSRHRIRFYERGDVLFASLHGEPENTFPYFLGYADETGAGEGANLNLPLPPGTGAERWFAALDEALAAIRDFGAGALVVSLGTDAFEHDPISTFRLASDDFARMGARIAAAALPTVLVTEGGYAIEAVGVNAVNVLEGFG